MCRTSGCEDQGCAKDKENHVLCLAPHLSSYPYHHMAGSVARFKPVQGHAYGNMYLYLVTGGAHAQRKATLDQEKGAIRQEKLQPDIM